MCIISHSISFWLEVEFFRSLFTYRYQSSVLARRKNEKKKRKKLSQIWKTQIAFLFTISRGTLKVYFRNFYQIFNNFRYIFSISAPQKDHKESYCEMQMKSKMQNNSVAPSALVIMATAMPLPSSFKTSQDLMHLYQINFNVACVVGALFGVLAIRKMSKHSIHVSFDFDCSDCDCLKSVGHFQ